MGKQIDHPVIAESGVPLPLHGVSFRAIRGSNRQGDSRKVLCREMVIMQRAHYKWGNGTRSTKPDQGSPPQMDYAALCSYTLAYASSPCTSTQLADFSCRFSTVAYPALKLGHAYASCDFPACAAATIQDALHDMLNYRGALPKDTVFFPGETTGKLILAVHGSWTFGDYVTDPTAPR